jgi:hypothetical protein
MRTAGDGAHGRRLRGLIVIMWRAGLRIQQALVLTEGDLDQRRGSSLVRRGGHSNLDITSVYLQRIDSDEIIQTVHARRAPMIPLGASLRL